MSAISELEVLLKSMSPQIIEGNYVFCTVKGPLSEYWHLDPIATFREQEGLTLVLLEQQAKAAKLKFDSVFSLITLTVHSSLEAVGLTAAFATKLASYGISANVIAGYYHDHIFVQSTLAEKALQALQEFTQQTDNENAQ
ncbi:ACT domain-containing protein [Vibrio sp. 11986-1-5]|uniref:ACT domain-containing protein n=1 Tax=Vibrio sp. 11986-1-5 TaxID=2211215 RepID=UPI000D73617C|nr:ACT domain-containing protein [Vibrio sp. 11986-1-5]PXA72664.1 transporter [Vibrio sp. 11986-1-5]